MLENPLQTSEEAKMSLTVDGEGLKKKVGNPDWNFVLPYEEARQIIKPYRFKTLKAYCEWVRETKPYGLSVNPYPTYTRRGEWVNTAHFLGKIDTIKAPEDKGIKEPVNFRAIKSIIKQILFGK